MTVYVGIMPDDPPDEDEPPLIDKVPCIASTTGMAHLLEGDRTQCGRTPTAAWVTVPFQRPFVGCLTCSRVVPN